MVERVAEWLAAIDGAYPFAHAAGWDSVGLQVGDQHDDVSGVLVCLDITAATIDEAVAAGANLIVAHHPLLFRPLDRLTPASAPGRLALSAARAGVNVVAAHTNFDAAADGTTAPILALLGIEDAGVLEAAPVEGYVKIVSFVPVASTSAVLSAAFAAGAGAIGEYDECSFRVTGTGTFRPSAQANPAVGAREERNDVAEDRVEVIVGRAGARHVVAAITEAHPYEEVALDVYPLEGIATAGGGQIGLGRIGTLPQPLTLRELALRLRDGLPSPLLRLAGDPDRVVTRVAACGGAGDSLIDAALRAGAELYVTGDLRHHVTLDALTQGMAVIDAGHFRTEVAALPALVQRLRDTAADRGLKARLLASEVSTEPWRVHWEDQRQ